MATLKINPTLMDAIVQAGLEGLSMTGIVPEPVGASRFWTASRDVSVLVSLIGDELAGSLTLNITSLAASYLSQRLLGEVTSEFDSLRLDDEMLDGICEIGNIIAGRAKDLLHTSEFSFRSISCPSLVMGGSYNLYHSRGMTTASVEFEIAEIPMTRMHDRFFSVSISTMKRS
jgi:CheY-specific phosphatase CheX